MNQLALLVSAYLALASQQAPRGLSANETEWAAYKLQFGKHYEDPQVDRMRSLIYARNKLEVERFNANAGQSKYYKQGLSHLSDLTEAELSAKLGLRVPTDRSHEQLASNTPEAERFLRAILQDDSKGAVPDEWDWRRVPGRVTSVKDQLLCGCCYAFSAVGALEGQEAVRRNGSRSAAIDLAVQQVVDCGTGTHGCGGGWMSDAMDYIKQAGGIVGNQSYPYRAKQGECAYRREDFVIGDSGHAMLPVGDEQKLKEVVYKFGPVAVAIFSGLLLPAYKEGIYYSPFCEHVHKGLDHAVLVVGYGTDHEKQLDYWLVKNSWGAWWGEQGYFRLARNKENHCGITNAATIPTF